MERLGLPAASVRALLALITVTCYWILVSLHAGSREIPASLPVIAFACVAAYFATRRAGEEVWATCQAKPVNQPPVRPIRDTSPMTYATSGEPVPLDEPETIAYPPPPRPGKPPLGLPEGTVRFLLAVICLAGATRTWAQGLWSHPAVLPMVLMLAAWFLGSGLRLLEVRLLVRNGKKSPFLAMAEHVEAAVVLALVIVIAAASLLGRADSIHEHAEHVLAMAVAFYFGAR